MTQFLCGIVNSALPDDTRRATLQRMAAAAGVQTTSPGIGPHGEREPFVVLSNPANHASDGRIECAFAGSPQWTDDGAGDGSPLASARSILDAYKRYDSQFLDRLRGAFTIVITDPENRSALIAIDRMGIHQLNYAHSAEHGLAFSTRAASVNAHPAFESPIDNQAVFDYLYFHMIPAPRSIYASQSKLGAGELIRITDRSLHTERYWQPNFTEQSRASERELTGKLFSVLRTSIQRSDAENTGCFLSGGIDSSTIVGLLSELRSDVETFTIGFDEPGYDETEFSQGAARHFGANTNEYCVTPEDVVSAIPDIAAAYDEPFGNSSVVPTYFCARLAREHGMQRLLAGDGGDELFGGNARYVTQQIFSLYDAVPGPLKRTVLEPVSFGLPGASKFMPTRKLQSYIRQARVPMPDRMQTYNYFSRTPADTILQDDFIGSISQTEPLELQRETYASTSSESLLNRMLEFDWKYTLADNDLRKVNRMCDLAGIDVVYPFLDDDVVAFSAEIPASLKIRYFKLRYFIKRALGDFLPRSVIEKSKHGFGLPFGVWMKSYGPLRELAYDSLDSLCGRGIARREYIDTLIAAHKDEHAHYYGEFIWVLMVLELWLQNAESSVRHAAGERQAAI